MTNNNNSLNNDTVVKSTPDHYVNNDSSTTKNSGKEIEAGGTVRSEDQHEEKARSFSQEEVNKIIAERLEREQKKFEKLLQEKTALAAAEAERLAKLTAEEKEKELLAKQQAELKAKELELTLKENKIEAYEKLAELKMPAKFVDFVLSEDKEAMREKIEVLHKEFTKAISQAVQEHLKGATQKAPEENNNILDSSTAKQIKTVF